MLDVSRPAVETPRVTPETSLLQPWMPDVILAHLETHGLRTFGDLDRLDLETAATWKGIGSQKLKQIISLQSKVRSQLGVRPPPTTAESPPPPADVEPSWETVAALLRPSDCRMLKTLGCVTVKDVEQAVEGSSGQKSSMTHVRTALEAAATRPLAPLPTTLPGLVDFLLTTLSPRQRALATGRYLEMRTLEELAGEASRQAVDQRLSAIDRLWQDRFPRRVASLVGPLGQAMDEAGGLLAPEASAGFELSIPQATLLLRAAGRNSTRWVQPTRRAGGWLNGWQVARGTDARGVWLADLGCDALNRRTNAFRQALKSMERLHVAREHLLQIWDETTGFALPEVAVWRLLEVVLDGPVSAEGLHEPRRLGRSRVN